VNADGAGDCSDDNLLLTEEHEVASSHHVHRGSVISLDSMDSHAPVNGGSSARREVFRRLKAPRNPVMPVNQHHKVIVIRNKERITLEEKVMQEIKDYQNVII
jgi:hypothetical protein